MGLDTFASRTPGEIQLTEEDQRALGPAEARLCGGMFSGDGGSFRGKVYLDVVDRVAEVSLSQEWIPPETVREMWEAFDRCEPQQVVRESANDRYPVTAEEVSALGDFLRVCVERGLGLIGWW